MGVERAVTRWYVQRQALLGQINELEEALKQEGQQDREAEAARQRRAARLAELREQLRLLGPCPRPMM
jgi:hypothetical protein